MITMNKDIIRIRNNWGPMPFDRGDSTGFGLVHATGREVLEYNEPGNYWLWTPEYEDDYTVDFPCTDPDYDPELEEYDFDAEE